MAESITQEALIITGMAGATAASRYAGATTFGAPTTGTFAVGDYVVDQSGAMYVCTVAGTPGTWQLSGVSVNENIAGKNFIINGGMDIWQRGTTFATGGGYTADRWYCYASGNAVAETQVASGLTGFKYALQVQRNSGQTSTSAIYATQSIETLNTLPMAGQIVNLSFWAKCGANYSGTSNQLTVQLIAGTGTDQNVISGFTGATALFGNTVNLSTSWQRFTVQTNSFLTASVASTYTQLGINFIEVPTGTAGANDWFQITGVQLEIAPQATPFSRAGGSIGGELALCQRYYYRVTTFSYQAYGIGTAISATAGEIAFTLPVTMRSIPSLLDYSSSGMRVGDGVTYYNSYTSVSLDTYWTTNNVAWVIMTIPSSSLTQYRPIFISNAGSGNSYIGVGAEL